MLKRVFLNGKLNLAKPYATRALDISVNNTTGVTSMNEFLKYKP